MVDQIYLNVSTKIILNFEEKFKDCKFFNNTLLKIW